MVIAPDGEPWNYAIVTDLWYFKRYYQCGEVLEFKVSLLFNFDMVKLKFKDGKEEWFPTTSVEQSYIGF